MVLSLLEGSRYDYILLGSESNPENIDKVILTPKSGGVGAPATAVGAVTARPADEDTDDDNAQGFANPQVPSETTTPVQPAATPGQTVKTPEQLLQELQRLRQQQQQQQQQAPGTVPR